jgi:hypothetical protein
VAGTFSFTLVPINATGTTVVTNGSFESGFAAFSTARRVTITTSFPISKTTDCSWPDW